MKNVIKLPKASYILRCKHCKINAFYIYLGDKDPFNIIGFECCECGDYWEVKSANQSMQPTGTSMPLE